MRFGRRPLAGVLTVSGDLAYQHGTFVVVSRPKAGGAESRITGNFLCIYRKIDGA